MILVEGKKKATSAPEIRAEQHSKRNTNNDWIQLTSSKTTKIFNVGKG